MIAVYSPIISSLSSYVLIFQHDLHEVPEREVRPKGLNEGEVRPSALPEKEVAQPLLSGRSQEQVHRREPLREEAVLYHFAVHVGRVDLPSLHVPGDRTYGVHNVVTPRVGKANIQNVLRVVTGRFHERRRSLPLAAGRPRAAARLGRRAAVGAPRR